MEHSASAPRSIDFHVKSIDKNFHLDVARVPGVKGSNTIAVTWPHVPGVSDGC